MLPDGAREVQAGDEIHGSLTAPPKFFTASLPLEKWDGWKAIFVIVTFQGRAVKLQVGRYQIRLGIWLVPWVRRSNKSSMNIVIFMWID